MEWPSGGGPIGGSQWPEWTKWQRCSISSNGESIATITSSHSHTLQTLLVLLASQPSVCVAHNSWSEPSLACVCWPPHPNRIWAPKMDIDHNMTPSMPSPPPYGIANGQNRLTKYVVQNYYIFRNTRDQRKWLLQTRKCFKKKFCLKQKSIE